MKWTNGDTIIWLSRNILGKGEIARYEQFLFFPQCFQKLLLMCKKENLWSEGLSSYSKQGIVNKVHNQINSTEMFYYLPLI